jgi:hypothetical protein
MVKFSQVPLLNPQKSIPKAVFRRSTNFMHKYQVLKSKRLHLLLVLLLLPLCNSCTMTQLRTFTIPTDDTQAFAEQLFINGDFERAILEYEQIYETALSSEDRNQALYGLACSQMMVARTDEQLIEAISNLQKWDANKGTAPLSENRHLLVLSLKQQRELLEEKNREKIAREAEQISLIDGQKIEISQMMSTVEKLQNQIEALQNQIEALEAIDENVQEKRKSL